MEKEIEEGGVRDSEIAWSGHSSQKSFQPRRGQSNQFNQPLIGWNGNLLTGWRDWKLKVRMEMCSFVDNRNILWKLMAVFGWCTLFFLIFFEKSRPTKKSLCSHSL